MDGLQEDTIAAYTSFAANHARGYSPEYEEITLGVARDAEVLAWLQTLPQPKRQPNLLLGAVRYLGGPAGSWAEFRDWLNQHRDEVAGVMATRATQTNEAGRCATLLPWLATIRGPLALIEVGCSAGLCLYPDRYSYRYQANDQEVRLGRGAPVLECTVGAGITLPDRLPDVAWRGGLDLNPLDLTEPDTVAWLAALIWPGQQFRLDRLYAAAEVAHADPPRLVRGNLLTDLPELIAEVPAGLTPVLFHSAVLAYVDAAAREEFAARARELLAAREGVWISNEGVRVLEEPRRRLGLSAAEADDAAAGRFVLAFNEEPVAWAGGHGQTLAAL